jgi:hypothetical protein
MANYPQSRAAFSGGHGFRLAIFHPSSVSGI